MGRRGDKGTSPTSLSADNSKSSSAAQPHGAIGSIRSATGSVAIIRLDGTVDQAAASTLLFLGDVIETGADGAVKIIFTNGAAFNLSADGRMVLDEFVCDAKGQLKSGLFNLVRGAFAFFTGRCTPSGDLSINTPHAKIRGTARSGGMGALTFAAFTFAMLKEAQAESQGLAFLIDDTMDTNDLEHGIFQVTTLDGQVTTIGDTLESVIIRPRGAGVAIERVINTPQQMADLLAASKDAQEAHQKAQQDIDITDLTPTQGGSSGSPGFVPPFLPTPDPF